MTDHENKVVVSEQPKFEPERAITRRNILKWGVVGVLIVSPIAIHMRKRFQENGYEYILQGPFQLSENNQEHIFRKSDWVGNTENRMYKPQFASLSLPASPKGKTPSIVELCSTFSVNKDIPVDFIAKGKITAETKRKIIYSVSLIWDAPHKRKALALVNFISIKGQTTKH